MNTQTDAQKKGLWGMSRPMLVEQSLQFSVPVLDIFFLSQISDEAASGAGSMVPVLFFCANMMWIMIFSGASVASQRLGANNPEKTNATIATYTIWTLLFGSVLTLFLYLVAPVITHAMGLPVAVKEQADIYMSIACWLMLVWGIKSLFQSILNVYGQPQWNMYANIVFFIANVAGNAIVIYGLAGFPKMGIEGIAWASVIGSICGLLVSGFAVIMLLKLRCSIDIIRREFKNASKQIARITLPGMIEPLSFDVNMIVLNGFAASLGAAALAAKVYTFNTFMLGLIISVALTTATQVLISQKVGAGNYEGAMKQMKQSLKAVLWGSSGVVVVLLALHHPIMDIYTDDEWLLASAFWIFLLAALSEPPRAINIMTGGVLRATGDGLLISIIGPLFTWIVALPCAYIMTFVFGWGIYGILGAALLDESVRAGMYWKRWTMNRWHHTHVHARENKAANS